jgi:hypothetical protein
MEKLACENCRAFCTDRSFSTLDALIEWMAKVEGALDEVSLDRPMDRARITALVKCSRCGQHFEFVSGLPGGKAIWGISESPPATQS